MTEQIYDPRNHSVDTVAGEVHPKDEWSTLEQGPSAEEVPVEHVHSSPLTAAEIAEQRWLKRLNTPADSNPEGVSASDGYIHGF